jgi:RNA polymerase sigma factor (sigma-70 family)
MAPEIARDAAGLTESAYRDHSAELHRFLLRRVSRAQDIDDIAQETFIRLLRVRDADLVRAPLAYLLGIASHVLSEFRQRQQNERVVFDSEMADALSEQAGNAMPMGVPDQLELQQRLEKALRKLPPTHQLVLLLVKRDGMSYTEAAQASGLSVHTIEKYVVEARGRLRVALADTGK